MRPIITRDRRLVVYESMGSTQTHLAKLVREGTCDVGAVVALEQTEGRGRHGRFWYTPKGQGLAVSWACFDYENWKKPELLGMSAALAVSLALDTVLVWPNDLMLSLPEGRGEEALRKVGGVLCELVPSPRGSLVPVVGVGVNLSIEAFPEELQGVATSFLLARGILLTWEEALQAIWGQWEFLPEPYSWQDLAPYWLPRDRSAGKKYRLPTGQVGEAVGITDEGWLLIEVN
ncbi:MAG: biotin--[acetyl-CoA-carboxylase] ligase, partial [Candidatus Caldarchaeum sp.]